MTQPERGEGASAQMRSVAPRDAVLVATDVLIPLIAHGLIIRRPRITWHLDRLDAQRRAVRRLQRLRERYGESPVLLALPGRRLALPLTGDAARSILERTPDPFAAATREKRAALSRFEPHGVLVSTGSARERRRRYNEEILETARPAHHLGDRFALIIDAETDEMLDRARAAGSLEWRLFAATWWWIVLGDSAREDERVTDELARLRADANWGPFAPRRRRSRDALLALLQFYVRHAAGDCLAAQIAATPADPKVDPVGQIPQWLFAFDAAGMASFRTLALLSAYPETAQHIRQEAQPHAEIPEDRLSMARASVLECLRLWPTTPAILRETTRDAVSAGTMIPARTLVLIFAPYFHRDPRAVPGADGFCPERWRNGEPPASSLMPFSLGPGQCPGRNLVLLTAGTLLTRILSAADVTQRHNRPLRPAHALPATLSPFRLRFGVTPASASPPRARGRDR